MPIVCCMPFLGSIIPNSVVGVGRAERAQKREAQRRADETEKSKIRQADGAELSPEAVDEAEIIRSTKGNESEEGREDRAEHARYGPGFQEPSGRGAIDIEG